MSTSDYWKYLGDGEKALPQHLMRRISPNARTGCWLTRPQPSGYGRVVVAGRRYQAHRFVYAQLVGPIPRGAELHHECENRACCYPGHLVVVGRRAHMTLDRRIEQRAPTAAKLAITHCARGHRFLPETTGYQRRADRRRQRYCRVCRRMAQRRRRELAR
jgi:hypothetical protein